MFGSEGRIEVEIPINIPTNQDTRIFLTNGDDHAVETIIFPEADQYTIQAELFADAVIFDTAVPVPPSDAVANMEVIEAVLRD